MNILMPQLGETVSEGKITAWLKSVGDQVQPGDNLFEVETDKVTMDVPAISAGVLTEILVNSGDSAKVGAVVAVVGVADGAALTSPSAKNALPALAIVGSSTRQAAVTAPVALQGGNDPFSEVRTPARNYGRAMQSSGVIATPLARRIAAEFGIDLAQIAGSGSNGRIFARDVGSARSSVTPPSPPAPKPSSVAALYALDTYREVPLGAMRSTIAARLVQAKQSVPHFYLTADVDVSSLIALRTLINEKSGSPDQARSKVSINDFIIRLWALALETVPAANVIWADDRVMQFSRVDIGVAVSVEDGLLTPLVRSADFKTVSTISSEMKDLAERARRRRLQPSEYQGGTSSYLQSGNVRRQRVRRDYQSASKHNPRRGCCPPAADGAN